MSKIRNKPILNTLTINPPISTFLSAVVKPNHLYPSKSHLYVKKRPRNLHKSTFFLYFALSEINERCGRNARPLS